MLKNLKGGLNAKGMNPEFRMVILLFLFTLPSLLFGQWSLSLTCQTYPSPYLSDWENNPGIVNITISYGGTVPETVSLESRLVSDEHGEIASGVSPNIVFTALGRVTRDNRDFINYRGITYNRAYRGHIVRTNRLLEGSYTLYVKLIRTRTGDILLDERTARFYILAFQPPTLIIPRNGDTILITSPVFQWEPATSHPGFKVRYRLKICEILPGQTPTVAINNIPLHEAVIENLTSFIYPNTAQPLELNKNYVWQIQARDKNNIPIGENQGESEIRKFRKGRRLISRPPLILFPSVTASRNVIRFNNFFLVAIKIIAPASYAITNIRLVVKNPGFQCPKYGENVTVSNNPNGTKCVWKKTHNKLNAGDTLKAVFSAVPVLFGPYAVPERVICDSAFIYFQVGEKNYQQKLDLRWHNPTQIDLAFKAADYLIMTTPRKLFSLYDDGAVNHLFCLMADLAIGRNGVLGYIPNNWHLSDIHFALQPWSMWGQRLCADWAQGNGYLLIVGEQEIVPHSPPFIIDIGNGKLREITLSDHIYSRLSGDLKPKLRVGRIVGKNARDLQIPINQSIAVDLHRAGAENDGSHALMITGLEKPKFPDGFVNHGKHGSSYLKNNKGVNVTTFHNELFQTKRRLLEVALKHRGAGQGGAYKKRDLSAYTVAQLAAWLAQTTMLNFIIKYPVSSKDSYFTDSEGVQRRLPYNFGEPDINDACNKGIELEVSWHGGSFGTYHLYDSGSEATIAARNIFTPYFKNRDLVIYGGHSGPGGWDRIDEGYADNLNIRAGKSRPVIISWGCSAGRYIGDDDGNSITRGFLRHGAAVYIGSPVTTSTGDFYEHVGYDGPHRFLKHWAKGSMVGDVLYNWKTDLANTASTNGCNLRLIYAFTLYGDPKFGGD